MNSFFIAESGEKIGWWSIGISCSVPRRVARQDICRRSMGSVVNTKNRGTDKGRPWAYYWKGKRRCGSDTDLITWFDSTSISDGEVLVAIGRKEHRRIRHVKPGGDPGPYIQYNERGESVEGGRTEAVSRPEVGTGP